ncbi:hypothetical protein ACWA2B_00350 [Paenibacillus sp. CMM36]
MNHWVKMQHVYQPNQAVKALVRLFISEHTWELGYKGCRFGAEYIFEVRSCSCLEVEDPKQEYLFDMIVLIGL